MVKDFKEKSYGGENVLSLEERVARLEGRLGWGGLRYVYMGHLGILCSAFTLLLGLLCAYYGLSFPNHYYQVVLAVIICAALYKQKILALPMHLYGYVLLPLNVACLSFLLKLFIGTGNRYPMSWMMYPSVKSVVDEEQSKWKSIIPTWDLTWLPGPLAEWSIDLTIVQTFLLLLTVLSAMVGFQPFASLVALLLVLFSIPALVSFSWPWVFPAILLIALAFYLQSSSYNED